MHFITPIAFTLTDIQRTFGEKRSLHGRFEEQGGHSKNTVKRVRFSQRDVWLIYTEWEPRDGEDMKRREWMDE